MAKEMRQLLEDAATQAKALAASSSPQNAVLNNALNRYNSTPGWGRGWACVASSIVISSFQEVDAACRTIAGFIDNCISEGAKLYGDEGVSRGMQASLAAMNSCFDFARLVAMPPGHRELSDFRSLAVMLLPILRKCSYPASPRFAAVVRGWPRQANLDAGLDLLVKQYELLMLRVRRAARGRLAGEDEWWTTTACEVAALRTGACKILEADKIV